MAPRVLPTVSRHHAKGRVIWTDAEKARLVARAVETQHDHPDLAGLPLLRSAMSALPASRRRSLDAVTQAPWFEAAVSAEIRRRTNEDRAAADLAPLIRIQTETLLLMLDELRHLNRKFGSPVPTKSPSDDLG